VLADSLWTINGSVADSMQVAQYLNTVSTISGSSFVDRPGSSAIANIIVETKSGQSTTFNAFANAAIPTAEGEEKKEPEYVVNSDALTNSYFEGSSVFSRLFVGKGKFKASKK